VKFRNSTRCCNFLLAVQAKITFESNATNNNIIGKVSKVGKSQKTCHFIINIQKLSGIKAKAEINFNSTFLSLS